MIRTRTVGIAGLLLALALAAGCGLPASQASPATPTTTPSAAQGVMPNVVGLLAGAAANQLHAQFGPGLSVQASNGAASTSLPVVSQIPAPGSLMTATTPVVLFTMLAAAPTTTTTTSPTTTTSEAPTSTAAPTTTTDDVDVPNPDLPDPKRRTGHSGHPCLPGERDGDGDGYCGEGR